MLDDLTPHQRAAVSAPVGIVVCIAGAGSGKTTVLTRRLAWLVAEGADPARCVAITFTNRAAHEMRERATQICPPTTQATISTFHAWCLRLLRRYAGAIGLPNDFLIADSAVQQATMRRILRAADADFEPAAVLALISDAKSRLEPFDQIATNASERGAHPDLAICAERYADAYQTELLRNATLDFDDLLVLVVRLLDAAPQIRDSLRQQIEHLLVDEYQDTNRVQAELLYRLAPASLFCVGDPQQSIYTWRGAEPGIVDELLDRYPEATLVRLEDNFRSTDTILAVANRVIAPAASARTSLRLRGHKGTGQPVLLLQARDSAHEATLAVRELRELVTRGTRLDEIAILVRAASQAQAFEQALAGARLPYQMLGTTRFVDRADARVLSSYLTLARNDHPDALRRVAAAPRRGLGETTVEKVLATGQPYIDALRDCGRQGGRELAEVMEGLRERMDDPSHTVLEWLLECTNYREWVARMAPETAEDRLAAIDQLLTLAAQSDRDLDPDSPQPIVGLLNRMALVSSSDEQTSRAITLSTIHAAKGLEWDHVFLPGWEDGSFPTARATTEAQLEEERRLAYVALTRARQRLFVSYAQRRQFHGSWDAATPSPFVEEIEDLCQHRKNTQSADPARRSARRPTTSSGVWKTARQTAVQPVAQPASPVHTASGPTPRPTGGWRAGMTITHTTFGIGTIQAVTENRAKVLFVTGKVVTLDLGYAPISLSETP